MKVNFKNIIHKLLGMYHALTEFLKYCWMRAIITYIYSGYTFQPQKNWNKINNFIYSIRDIKAMIDKKSALGSIWTFLLQHHIKTKHE